MVREHTGHEFEQAVIGLLRHFTPEQILRDYPRNDVR